MAPSNLLRLATRRSVAPLSFRPALLAKRQFSQTALQSYPRVGSQDKDSIDTEATEYSKSGTDDGAARQEDAAFNPNKTGPEDEKNTAGDGNNSNPLNVSPANPEVSKQTDSQEGGAENSGKDSNGRQSGHGSPSKGGQ